MAELKKVTYDKYRVDQIDQAEVQYFESAKKAQALVDEAQKKASQIMDDANGKAYEYKSKMESDMGKQQVTLNGLKAQLELKATALNKLEHELALKKQDVAAREALVSRAEDRIALAERERAAAIQARDEATRKVADLKSRL